MRLFLALALLALTAPAAAQVPDPAPAGFWAEFYAAAKTAGWFGTLVMTLMWWLERRERKDEQGTGEKRHAAVMEALNAVKTFMEVIRDRFPRQP